MLLKYQIRSMRPAQVTIVVALVLQPKRRIDQHTAFLLLRWMKGGDWAPVTAPAFSGIARDCSILKSSLKNDTVRRINDQEQMYSEKNAFIS